MQRHKSCKLEPFFFKFFNPWSLLLLKPTSLHLMGKLGKRLKRSRLEASLEEQHTDGGALDLVECVRVGTALARDLHFYHSAAAKPLRTVLFPLLSAELASGAHFEASPVALEALALAQELTLSSCAALTALCARPDAVAQLRGCKELRRAL